MSAVHPVEEVYAGARPGEVIVRRQGYAWKVYEYRPGVMCAAVFIDGRLLRRDLRGWWIADYVGRRVAVAGDPVARLEDTVPAGWPLHPEQVGLFGEGADDE